MELKGRLLPSMAFASDPMRPYPLGVPGLEEKSSISLLISMPVPGIINPDP